MKKFHLTERGPASCTASKRPCPYGGKSGNENHFSDLKIAETAFATLMGGNFPTMTETERMKHSKVAAVIGAVRSLDAIYNGFREDFGEAEFDTTQAGKLAHLRRLMVKTWDREKHLERKKLSEVAPLVEMPLPEYPVHGGWRKGNVSGLQEGNVLREGYSTENPDEKKADQIEIIRLSQQWVEVLTPEEQEAVAWVTRNGSRVIGDYVRGGENAIWGFKDYSPEYLEKQNALLASATKKAPKLDTPLVLYRGVKEDNEGADFSTKWEVGKTEEVNFPRCTSLNPSTAAMHHEYDQPVIYEFEVKTVCPTACLSAWRAIELEFLIPYKKFECVSIQDDVDFGKNQKFKVIQLREVG